MPVLINFKICDNALECSGISVCPVKAFYFNEKTNKLTVDDKKCINCGLCAKACSVGAIHFAKTEAAAKKIQKMIDEDTRTYADLFVERFGAILMQSEIVSVFKNWNKAISSNRPTVVEVNTDATIECLIKSVPIKEILQEYHPQATYRKFLLTENELKQINIATTPCLLFYAGKGKLVGKIEGHFTNDERFEMFDKIKGFAKKI